MASTSQKYAFLSPPQNEGELGRLGSYCIRGLIGKGGMGQVFLAKDMRLQRDVALKVMSNRIASSPKSRSRFIREARAQAAVHHDNVATIFEVGEENKTPFLAMELLKGHALEQVLSSKSKFDYEQILAIGGQVARGLSAAHARGIIHRDIKPANIWISKENGRPKILDFGLAALTGPDSLSSKGAVVGTPGYLAPEQARDEPVDDRSDIYSLGIVLYEMCSGRIPFKYSNIPMTLIAIATHRAKPLKKFVPEIPESVSDLIERMLSPDPGDRPSNAIALAEDLDYVNEGLAFGPLGSSDSISFSFDDVPRQSEIQDIKPLQSVPMEAAKSKSAKKEAASPAPTPVIIVAAVVAILLVAGVAGFAWWGGGDSTPSTASPNNITSATGGPKPNSQANLNSQKQSQRKGLVGADAQSGMFQQITMSANSGADMSVGPWATIMKPDSTVLAVHERGVKRSPFHVGYLKFSLSPWKHPVSAIADAQVSLTCRASPPKKCEFQLYGVPRTVLSDWSDRGDNLLTKTSAPTFGGLGKVKLLASAAVDNTDKQFNFVKNYNVQFMDPRIGDFVRAEGADKSITFAVVRSTVDNKASNFVSREANNNASPKLGLRRK